MFLWKGVRYTHTHTHTCDPEHTGSISAVSVWLSLVRGHCWFWIALSSQTGDIPDTSSLPQLGANSGVHIIIFDEIDAICKQRGSMAGSTGVHDTVVNQLLSKIDGVEQLNNILVIGRWGCLALS